MRIVTFTSALAAGLALSVGAFAQTPGCTPKAHQTQGIPQGVYESSRPHPKFTAGEQTGVDTANQARMTAGGGGMPAAVESSQQPRPRFTAGEQTGVNTANPPRMTAGGGGIPGGVYDSSQPHPRFTAGQTSSGGQRFAQAGDPCK